MAEQFQASPATVRRDIAEMEEAGLVERTWGGSSSRVRWTTRSRRHLRAVAQASSASAPLPQR
ncbi:DeoR family transcriptional regulator [Tessaracoccus sp. HDW20]|nr:DeoR family transcriptional regulator [Tessaracoccus coleopterorum]